MTRRECTSTKSIDGGSCSERVPCGGVVAVGPNTRRMTGGCDEPCDFLSGSAVITLEEAFRAGYHVCADRYMVHGGTPLMLRNTDKAWQQFNGEKDK